MCTPGPPSLCGGEGRRERADPVSEAGDLRAEGAPSLLAALKVLPDRSSNHLVEMVGPRGSANCLFFDFRGHSATEAKVGVFAGCHQKH